MVSLRAASRARLRRGHRCHRFAFTDGIRKAHLDPLDYLEVPERLLSYRPEVAISGKLEEDAIPGSERMIRVDPKKERAHGSPAHTAAGDLEQRDVLQ